MSTVEAPASHLPLPMQNILSRLAANSTEAEQALVRKAYAYAAAAHAGQVRLSGEPYLSHPLAVAEVLAELGFDAHSVAAGLLHDTVEDTKVTLEEVDAEFGEQVADIVDGVTKISMMTFDSKEEQQAENIRKMTLRCRTTSAVPHRPNWLTACTTCGRSISRRPTSGSASRRRRWTFTCLSPTALVCTGSSWNLKA